METNTMLPHTLRGGYRQTGSRTIRRRTIRRGQFGAGQFVPDNSAQSIYYRFYIKSRFLSALFFSSKLLPFQQFVITPASISAIFFHQFLTITHTVLIGIGLLVEFIILRA